MALPACQGQLKVGSSGGAPPHLPFKYQHFQTQAEAFANFSECNANVSNASNYNRMYPPPPRRRRVGRRLLLSAPTPPPAPARSAPSRATRRPRASCPAPASSAPNSTPTSAAPTGRVSRAGGRGGVARHFLGENPSLLCLAACCAAGRCTVSVRTARRAHHEATDLL